VKIGQPLIRNTGFILCSYVHGVMDGEAMDDLDAGLFETETIIIN
jgi:hypothetical protein